jgi:hypothetical protein
MKKKEREIQNSNTFSRNLMADCFKLTSNKDLSAANIL